MPRNYRKRICDICEQDYSPTGSKQSICKNCNDDLEAQRLVNYLSMVSHGIKRYNEDNSWDVDDISWA